MISCVPNIVENKWDERTNHRDNDPGELEERGGKRLGEGGNHNYVNYNHR